MVYPRKSTGIASAVSRIGRHPDRCETQKRLRNGFGRALDAPSLDLVVRPGSSVGQYMRIVGFVEINNWWYDPGDVLNTRAYRTQNLFSSNQSESGNTDERSITVGCHLLGRSGMGYRIYTLYSARLLMTISG